ncbi:Serine/threonine-protein kinase cbk1 [Golovinomyces cichoracearum]|uniref:non-specific serine/threonine protein kinase n=1 Tax=Golovinomyces cichoracearum TaxID=62708 RepID=A0A420IEM5_9PEZI|nr:Serine/threonine-protein kinase cbk1 [Golovinomyces cichoracearum]
MNHIRNKHGPIQRSTPCEEYGPTDKHWSNIGINNPFENKRPFKFYRQESKFFSILRSLSSSVSNSSSTESTSISPPSSPSAIGSLFSPITSSSRPEHTIVHRTQFKIRPNIISVEKGLKETLQETYSSNAQVSNRKSGDLSICLPRAGDLTAKTSLNFNLSGKQNIPCYPLPGNRFLMTRSRIEDSIFEKLLAPDAQSINLEVQTEKPTPTFVTVERVASVKIFLERHYNKIASNYITPRSLRRRRVEGLLNRSSILSTLDKGEIRQSLLRDETEHLRRSRVMKSRKFYAKKGESKATSMYEGIKVLGKGSFGVVRLVRERLDNINQVQFDVGLKRDRREVYAMKVIKKSNMLQNSQEGHLHAERDFFVAAEGSRWVVPLIASFQDDSHLYLVMEYMPGGDFLGLLIRENVLSEPVTKWYIAEMILCVEEAHNLHWIHRDIKPDNFLISASGHLKISDFGLAFDGHWSHDQSYINNHRYSLLTKLGLDVDGDSIDRKEGKSIATIIKTAQVMMGGKERHEIGSSIDVGDGGVLNWRTKNSNRSFARSVVGTSQYMAPEVVRGEIYDARCDWWSIAIILYECLYGHTPFLAEEGGRQQTKLNIINHKAVFKFPQRPLVGRKCQDLIRNMIQEKENRLCSKRYRCREQPEYRQLSEHHDIRYVYPNDAEDIKAHMWFRDIPWDRLHMMIPPVVPKLQAPDDTHYFDEEESISDFSDSFSDVPRTQDDIADALRPFNHEIKILAHGYIDLPHNSIRLRKIDKEIDEFVIPEEQKQYLKTVVRLYGRKEKKRPRDILLRDKSVGSRVLDLRKEGAFLGYTYRRFRPRQRIICGSSRQNINALDSSRQDTVFHHSRLNIH